MSGRPPQIIREGENDTTLEHYTDTDPNRIEDQRPTDGSISAPPRRPLTGDGSGVGRQASGGLRATFAESNNQIEGTEGNPLRGQPAREDSGSLANSNQNMKHATDMPDVGAAVNMGNAPTLKPKHRTGAPSGVFGESGANNLLGVGGATGSNELSVSDSRGFEHQSNGESGGLTSIGSPSYNGKSMTLNARRQAHGQNNAQAKKNGKKGNDMFASMMLGGTNAGAQDFNDAISQRMGDDDAKSVGKSARRQSMQVGDVIGALPEDEGPAMLVPATMEAPDQIFMPNMKREPYVPVRLARDKIKQALSEIASHNSKHYAAIDTMEKQYEILKAQMEHQVATYAKKLTFHYNQRVADLNKQLKERLSAGSKGQAFSQLMEDVETWKSRATDAEQELELVKKELAKVKAERDQALAAPKRAANTVTASAAPPLFGVVGTGGFGSGSLDDSSTAPPYVAESRTRHIDDNDDV